jgi:hypothetical protein
MQNGIPVGGYPKGHWNGWDFEPYIQDDWKMNRRLTLISACATTISRRTTILQS